MQEASAARSRATSLRQRILWGIGGALLASLVLAAAWISRPSPPSRGEARGPARFEVVGAAGEALIEPWSLAVSPDGKRIAWVVREGAQQAIWIREIDALEARRLPDTDGATRPTFSPDGRSIAFYAAGKLRRFDLGGRRAIDLCPTLEGAGISWGDDGAILFNDGWIHALSRVSAEGGPREPATRLDAEYGEIGHWFPQLLPGGRHVLISRWRTSLNDMTVAVASLESGEIRELVPRASFARYVPPGRLLFTRAGAIHVVDFDADRLEVTGRPAMLLDGVEQNWDNGMSPWAVSGTGILVYLPGSLWTTKRTVARVSRRGEIEPLDVEPGGYVHVAMSPDGRRLALTEFENGRTNVKIRDLQRGGDTHVPLEAVNAYPVWSPDGREIVFDSARKGPWDIYRFPVDGGSAPEGLLEDTPDQIALAWSPDGRFVLWEENYAEVRSMDLRGDRMPQVVLPVRTDAVSFSPDSKWIAYHTLISGRREVLVRRFPDGTRDHQISIEGGAYPLWSRDGREVLYRRGAVVFAATLRISGDDLVAERPRELFRDERPLEPWRQHWSSDPTTDGLVMLLRGDHEISRDRFVVVLDWPATLTDGQ